MQDSGAHLLSSACRFARFTLTCVEDLGILAACFPGFSDTASLPLLEYKASHRGARSPRGYGGDPCIASPWGGSL